MSGRITPRNQRLVAQASGNRCAFPHCMELLVEDGVRPVIVGEIAHIRGERPGAARYDADQPPRERNAAPNLMLLCTRHHTIVDGQPVVYPVEALLAMKAAHENWVQERLSAAAAQIAFIELEGICNALATGGSTIDQDTFQLTPPREKIQRNRLTKAIESRITIGMARTPEVRRYLETIVAVDSTFADRLVNRFRTEYKRLYDSGLRADGLFVALHRFADQGSTNFDRQAAALVVLTYLFEVCEVFRR